MTASNGGEGTVTDLWNYVKGRTPAQPQQPANPPKPPAPPGHITPYANAAVENECATLASMPPDSGRNHALNRAAFNLGSLILAGEVEEQYVRDKLLEACHHNGVLAEDGQRKCEQTIDSGLRGANVKVGAREVKPLEDTIEPAAVLDLSKVGMADADTEEAREQVDAHTLAVRRRAHEIRVNEEARTYYNTWVAKQLGQSRPAPQMLDDMLAVPDLDATYRIENLLPTGGRALLAAQFKAGKTSMMSNMIRALVDGGSFLDTFPVDPVDRITLIDTELDENMLRRWLRDQGIRNTHKVQVFCLKGKLSTFDIINGHTRALWAEDIKGSDFVILDCLRPCLDAIGLSEDKDAGKFLVGWDALMAEAGATESVVVHHVGHVGERSRGDSRLLDWADVNWKIVKESQQEGANQGELSDGGRRFFSAHGRDVNVAEGQLVWNAENRSLTFKEGGRKVAKTLDTVDEIRKLLSNSMYYSGIGIVALTEKLGELGIGKHTARNAIKKAIEDRVLIETPTKGNAKLLILNPSEAGR